MADAKDDVVFMSRLRTAVETNAGVPSKCTDEPGPSADSGDAAISNGLTVQNAEITQNASDLTMEQKAQRFGTCGCTCFMEPWVIGNVQPDGDHKKLCVDDGVAQVVDEKFYWGPVETDWRRECGRKVMVNHCATVGAVRTHVAGWPQEGHECDAANVTRGRLGTF